MVKVNLGNFEIDMFDHGVIVTVHFRLEWVIKEFPGFGEPILEFQAREYKIK